MTYDIYVMSHSDLFREGLNAVAAFCQGDGFKALTWVGAVVSICMSAMAYVKQHDVMVYVKWLATYFFVFNVLLGVPSTVAVINTSDQSVPAQIIDNVPFGIALPAHLITTLGTGFSSDLETVFALPSERQYHKTGMLFGSYLFRLSLAARVDDATLANQMHNYVRSCVIGDILINHKYTFNDVLHSDDLWALMTRQPSPIRGMFVDGAFKSCVEAAHMLTLALNDYTKNTAPLMLSKLVPSQNRYAVEAINTMLTSSYQYFQAASQSATDILRQNIAINAFRAGIQNYAAEAGSVASLQNIANTQALQNTRMAWATSRHLGIHTLPLMQVVLLLLLLCLFPVIAALTLIPGLGFSVFKNYLYSLIWLETWPVMYTILNMAMNFYLRATSHTSVTLSSINLLAEVHSDIAGIAGYLVLAIPFLSLGIVKGMAFTFNNAAQYLGGMMHSIAQSSAANVASGNYALGNVSTDNATANNINANKHDTNFTSLQGLSTQQLGNGATVAMTPVGHAIYSAASGMSQLAVSAHAATSVAAQLSHQADQSITDALQHNTHYVQSEGHQNTRGSSMTSGVSAQVDHAMNTIHSLTHGLAKKEDINERDAFQKLSQASAAVGIQAGIQGGKGKSVLGGGISGSVGGNINVGATGQSTSQYERSYVTDADQNISASDAHNFSDALHTLENYANTHSYSTQNSEGQNLAVQMMADLNNATRLNASAQFVESHSDAFNTNFNQAFANYVESHYPEEANAILSATGDPSLLAKQEQLAQQFIQTHAKALANQYAQDSRAVQSTDLQDRQKYAVQNYQHASKYITDKGAGLGMSQAQSENFSNNIRNHLQQNQTQIATGRESQAAQVAKLKASTDKHIEKGKHYAKKGVFSHLMKGL